MHTTKLFKNGNSQAVRIPAEMAYKNTGMTLEIEREGDEIRIRPVRRNLGGVLRKFAALSPDVLPGGREPQEQAEREAL